MSFVVVVLAPQAHCVSKAHCWQYTHDTQVPAHNAPQHTQTQTNVHLGGSVGFYSGNVQELLDDVLVSFTHTHNTHNYLHTRASLWVC